MHPFPLTIRNVTPCTAGIAIGLPCGCNLLLTGQNLQKPLWCAAHDRDGEKLRLEAWTRRYSTT